MHACGHDIHLPCIWAWRRCLAELEVGKLGFSVGPALAAVDHFKIVARGKQAHGAVSHLSVSPVVMVPQAVSAFETIRSRNFSSLDLSVATAPAGVVR